MAVYIILLAVSVAAGIPLCSRKYGKNGKAIYCAAGALVFIFVASARFDVGYDYHAYSKTFTDITFAELEELETARFEKGFLIPQYVLNLITEDYIALFICVSIVIYGMIFWLIYKYSEKPWISVTAFLCFGIFFNSLCFLRQMIAAVIVAFAMKYIISNQPYKYIIMILLASTFHWSALVMIPMYIMLKIKPGYIYQGAMAVLTILTCIFSKMLMNYAVDIFYMYRSYDVETSVEASNGLTPLYTIMFAVLFVLCFVFRNRLVEKNSANVVYINCLMYTVICEALGMRHAILSRFALLFYLPPMLFLLPDLVAVIREYVEKKVTYPKRRKAVSMSLTMAAAVYCIAIYGMLMANDYNGVMPYETIIGMTEEERYGGDGTFDTFYDYDYEEDDEEDLEEDAELTEETAASKDSVVTSEAPASTESSSSETSAVTEENYDEDMDDEWDEEWDEDFDEDAFNDALLEELESVS